MKLVAVNCNGCGAALDAGPDTRFVTCVHCGARLAVKRSESAAYTEVLEKLERKTDAIADQLAAMQRQNEVERIDREWEKERETYLSTSKSGKKYEPSATLGIIAGSLMGLFGLVWSTVALSSNSPTGFGCFGFMFLVAAIAIGITSVVKARQFEEARQRYRKRRAAALAKPVNSDASHPSP